MSYQDPCHREVTQITFIAMESKIAVAQWSFTQRDLCCYDADSTSTWWKLKLYLKCERRKVSKQSVNPSRTAHVIKHSAAK